MLEGIKYVLHIAKAYATHSANQHLIYENTQSPPVHRCIIWMILNDLRGEKEREMLVSR